MTDVGTWAWAQRTDGRLSRRDHLDQLRRGVWAQLRARAARSGGWPWPDPPELPTPPDSVLAREATEYAADVSSPALLSHCLRTWLFASAYGAAERLAYDEELLYLACVLHDLGLTPAHDGRDATAACFAVEGARAAHQLLLAGGASTVAADTVAGAISLHLNIEVRSALGAEAHLLSRGVSADAIGRDLRHLPVATTAEVVRRHPRDGFADELVEATRRQAAKRPQSRSAMLVRFGFTGMVRANPLDRIAARSESGER
jgi:hypothetical protein